jgi:cytochrome P450
MLLCGCLWLAAGHEPTAATMAAALYCTSAHPAHILQPELPTLNAALRLSCTRLLLHVTATGGDTHGMRRVSVSDNNILSCCMCFAAGHETTATTTAAALYCISVHPAVESRLMAELQQVLGDRPPAYADLEQLPYLQVCVISIILYNSLITFRCTHRCCVAVTDG